MFTENITLRWYLYKLSPVFLMNRRVSKKRRTCFKVAHCEFSMHVYVLVYEWRNKFGIYLHYLLGKKHIFKICITAM